MQTFEFTAILADRDVLEIGDADRLYEAGCDDATCSSSEGVVTIDFDREAPHLEDAVRSAIADISKAGFRVARIVLDVDAYQDALA